MKQLESREFMTERSEPGRTSLTSSALLPSTQLCSIPVKFVHGCRRCPARGIISPGSADARMLMLTLLMSARARARPEKAETTHLLDAATAFLKGAETKCSK